jgi:hypothetical protein
MSLYTCITVKIDMCMDITWTMDDMDMAVDMNVEIVVDVYMDVAVKMD